MRKFGHGYSTRITRRVSARDLAYRADERTNYEFRRLAERYDEVNRNIYRIESGEEPTSDEVLARLKKWRLKLKDEIAAILTKLEHRL
jgi:uncharacterized protein YdcH (DUF465 family)